MDDLKVTIYQADIFWEDIDKNLLTIEEKLTKTKLETDLIILPEMFNTGFSMQAKKLAEPMDGKTIAWMAKIAKNNNCVVTGSLIIKENSKYYNRLVWMNADGSFSKYDKKHLFGLGLENENYTPGVKRLIVELNGWKICPVICYDLRFPIWLRNKNTEYDLLLIVANWPEARIEHWIALIKARAIENQAFAIGVNRIGLDGNKINYTGDSICVTPLGNTIFHNNNDEIIQTVCLSGNEILKTRSHLPFLNDADNFMFL
jgi:predicted amidohydrolase